jgi:hypothetical protein
VVPARHLALILALTCCAVSCSSRSTTQQVSRVAAAAPAAVVFPAEFEGFKKEEFERHVEALKKRLPSKEFTIVVQPPFVVIGDEPASVVQERAEGTIKWAVEKLKQDFFTEDPKEILDIWLFKDAHSYEKHALLLFKAKPHTPYGYYSSEHKSLVMNISTGGGTLVHEIVHPFIEADFPACPPWLNEGMGSLYEQCGEQDGHIHGFVNWRLPGLQKAIEARRVPAFKTLLAMDADMFYGDRSGVNYAQARYLCYYQFRAGHEKDPSGFETLNAVLRESDMDQFKRKWERYVLQLVEEFRLQ